MDEIADQTVETKTEEEGVAKALVDIQEENTEKSKMVNKRIDFNKKTLKRIETMLPVYSEDLGEKAPTNKIFSYVIQKAVDALFEGDFKKKIEEL